MSRLILNLRGAHAMHKRPGAETTTATATTATVQFTTFMSNAIETFDIDGTYPSWRSQSSSVATGTISTFIAEDEAYWESDTETILDERPETYDRRRTSDFDDSFLELASIASVDTLKRHGSRDWQYPQYR